MNKIELMFNILDAITPLLPMSVVDMQEIVMDYLIDNNQNEITTQAMLICHIDGVASLLDWFGTPPLYTDETQTIISILRIKSASEDD